MSWLSGGADREQIIGMLPELAGPYRRLYEALFAQSHLPPEILELCRLRLAQLHRNDLEFERRDMALSEDRRSSLSGWESNKAFSAPERACLAFTEVYAMDAQALTDEQADAVKEHFGDAGLVTLIEALGILDGMTRLSLLWQLGEDAQ